MGSLSEDRVFAASTQPATAYVAAGIGVLRLQLGPHRIGEFGIAYRCRPHDITVTDNQIVVATDEDVIIKTSDTFERLGFGPAVAVGGDTAIVAGAPDGRVARYTDNEWTDLGTIGRITAIEGGLIGTPDGLYKIENLSSAGLSRINDISRNGTPYVATDSGLYSFETGWHREINGAFWSVTTGSTEETPHVIASTPTACYRRETDTWNELTIPDQGSVVDGAFGNGLHLLTADGVVLTNTGSSWRQQPLGVNRPIGIEIPERKTV